MLLSSAFREQVKKTKDIAQIEEMKYNVGYSTGFLPLDFLNGDCFEINSRLYYQIGIVDGSINAFISESGGGKTTFTIQSAANIIRPFKTSCVFMEAAESGSALQRAMQLTGFGPEEFKDRFICRDAGITTESFQERVKMIYSLKMQHYDEYAYDTGIIDDYGKPVIKLEPTVVILDSLKMVIPEKISEEATNMAGAQTAKANSDMFIRLLPMCRQANIIILVINHITTSGIGSVMPQKSALAYLKQGESLPGGKSVTYLNNNIIRLDRKSKLKETEGFGIDGTLVNAEIIKSRTNKAGKGCTLVFDQAYGYDPDLSLFMMLKENNTFEGAGAYLRLPGLEDVKFSQKNFKQTLYTNTEFYNKFIEICLNLLREQLLNRYNARKEMERVKSDVVSPYQAILNQLQNQQSA